MRFNVDKTFTKIKSFLDLDTQDSQFSRTDQPDFFESFIHDLKQRRHALSWTIETLSEKTGISTTLLEGMEAGTTLLTADEMQVYVNALGLSFQLVEIVPLEDLIQKQTTTEIISTLQESEIAIGDCGKYITKDPDTKAIMECSEQGELLGPLSLTKDVMQSRWRVVKHADPLPDAPSDSLSQNELEKEIFVNIVYSDLNYKQLKSYLTAVQDKLQDQELSQMIQQLCQEIEVMEQSEAASLDTDSVYKDIRQSKERIVDYFFRGIHLRNQE